MESFIRLMFTGMLILQLTGALLALLWYRKPKTASLYPNLISLCAALSGLAGSIALILFGPDRIVLVKLISAIPLIQFHLVVDRLSAFFLMALSLLSSGVSVYAIGYLGRYDGTPGRNPAVCNILTNLFISSMILVLTMKHLFGFLIAWELMSLISFFLVVFEADSTENQKAGFIYLVMTHMSTAFLMIAFLLVHHFTGTGEISPLTGVPAILKTVLFICFLIGFGTKAGIVPLHIWLPYAHPAAPGHISALMSGIMIKTAVYGLIRFIWEVLGASEPVWGIILLICGLVSTMIGIAYALIEQNLKRLLAFSSIENMGIIFIGLGISLIARTSGRATLASLALFAALFHLLNHTIFKGALFLGAGSIQYATKTKNLEHLGGLMKKMPVTGVFFLLASLAISAIPPLNGFIGEWLTFQALFGQLMTSTPALQVLTMLSVAGLAMAGALAAACFVKVCGIAFLGQPRSEQAATAGEVPLSMRSGIGFLTCLCLILGLFPGLMVRLLDRIVTEFTGVSLAGEFLGKGFFLFYPLQIQQEIFSPHVFMVGMLLLLGITLMVTRFLGKNTSSRRYQTWECGFGPLTPRMQYTATGFSKLLRIVLRSLFQPTRELKIEEGTLPYFPKKLRYEAKTQPVFEKYLYRPLRDRIICFASQFKDVIQTGSVHTYLVYIMVTLIVLLIYYMSAA